MVGESEAVYNNDVLIIAEAFRQARDEDTRQTLNVMAAKKTASSLDGLKYYMVPSQWLVKAWPMLSAGTPQSKPPPNGNGGIGDENKWRERVGPIQNASLLAWDHAVSSSDEEGGENGNSSNKPPKLKKQQQPPDSCPLRRDLSHGEDYFLLGPNMWLLVEGKFGTDGVVLDRPCEFHDAEESTLAVAIDRATQNGGSTTKRQRIPVPPAGYFPYQKLIEDLEGDSQESFLPQGGPQQQPLQQVPEHSRTDVVSDEDGEPNDLAPNPSDEGPDDMVISSDSDGRLGASSQSTSRDNVLLLPASTTVSPANSNNNNNNNGNEGGSLYPAVQDMECSGDPANAEIKEDPATSASDENGVVTTAIATTAFKRYGSGLGNLGNTCFMNSTLQCLAHTGPLRRYFLSGEYEQDLNRDNPLGTGGDLAVQFAQLLAEMWGTTVPVDRRRVFPKVEYSATTTSSVVYPRNFKFTLGKHAEQFMGYDQHDSQELATYLLDALHEDTNRVTKKPYVEKPEKGEDEPDEVAAKKAWDLHLKREDSRVLENFMGQVKSRVQCCKAGCGRVSTTFDPFMYLSVPIPGSTERTMRVTFVPLDGRERKKNVSITLSRAATVGKLITRMAEQLMKLGFSANGRPFSLEDLCPCDVWSHDVYTWYEMGDEIDKIRDTDETAVYQVQPMVEIRKAEEDNAAAAASDTAMEDEAIEEILENSRRSLRYKLDLATNLGLGQESWKGAMENYFIMPNTNLARILNPERGTNAERLDLYQKMDKFVSSCIQETDKASNKRAREEEEEEGSPSSPQEPEQTTSSDSEPIPVQTDEDEVPALIKVSEASTVFTKVKTRLDVAVLEVCAGKLRKMILESVKSSKKKPKDGSCYIQVTSRRCGSTMGTSSYSSTQEKAFVNPLVLRIPATMTVYSLREELAKRLERSLRLQQTPQQVGNPVNESERVASESDVIPMEGDSDRGDEDNLPGVESMTVSSEPQNNGDPALQILRQIPLSYKRKLPASYGSTKNSKRLGSLDHPDSSDDTTPISSLASPTDEAEKLLVSDIVCNRGTVYLDWPIQLADRYFDEAEFDLADEVKDPDEEEAIAARNRKANRTTTILDCVEKYCQMEQLEETEMWYCNRCKEHVRAWKQFHLYRAPPILIMHLKRFQYSASTHRRDKISTFIDFPLDGLDLSDTVMHYDDGEKPIYDCYAVSNHYGGLGGGHYTAYALNDDGVWCHYDDSRITDHVDPKEVVSEAAYVVYYRRRDVEITGDFLENLETVPAIVADHFDKKEPSEASSTGAAQGDDMDVDINNTDAGSVISSKTDSSPMDSHDGNSQGGHDHYSETDLYGSSNDNYPLQ